MILLVSLFIYPTVKRIHHWLSLNRHFHLLLSPNTQHLHGYIQAHLVNSSGHTRRHPIQFDEFLQGHVFGERFSHVNAHVDGRGVVTAIIKLEHDTLFNEVFQDYKYMKRERER